MTSLFFQCLIRSCLRGRDELVALLYPGGFRVFSRLSAPTFEPAPDDVDPDLVRKADAVMELGFFEAMARPTYLLAEANHGVTDI